MATPWSEVQRQIAAEAEFQRTLEPSDPRHKRMFKLDLELHYIDVYWGGYEYSFELERIDSPQKLLAFLDHILTKTWKHSTGQRVGLLIGEVSRHFGWDLHGAERWAEKPVSRTSTAAQERARLTPSLRYDVLLRDDFRCRACGFSVESGAHLHIDHIQPVSKGGLTEINNLQALCSICNLGKGARK